MTVGPALDQLRHRRGRGQGRHRRRRHRVGPLRGGRGRRLLLRAGRHLRRLEGRRGVPARSPRAGCSVTSWRCRWGSSTARAPGLLVSRMTADVEALQDLISQGLAVFVVSAVLVLGTLVAMLILSWQLALAVLAAQPGARGRDGRGTAVRRAAPYLRVRDRVGGTLTALQEGLAGVRIIQAFDQTDRTVGEFVDTSREQYRTSVGAERITAVYNGVIQLVQGVTLALIIGLGAYFGSEGAVTRRRRHRVRALPQQPVRADPTAHAGVQHVPAVGRRTAQALRAARHAHRPGTARGAGRVAARGRPRPSTACRSATHRTSRPCCGDVSHHARAGEAARARRADRRGQVDAGQADGTALRPDRRHGRVRRRRPPPRRRAGTAPAASW